MRVLIYDAINMAEVLDLSGRRLQDFDAAKLSAEEQQAQVVDLSCNFMQQVPPSAFLPLRFVTKLYLGANELQQIPDLTGLSELKELYLNNNKLTNLDGIQAVSTLRVLNLRGNQLKNIDALSTLVLLEHLSLSANLLTSEAVHQANIGQLTRLRFVGVYANLLNDFGALLLALEPLILLQELIASMNNFQEQPSTTTKAMISSRFRQLQWFDWNYLPPR